MDKNNIQSLAHQTPQVRGSIIEHCQRAGDQKGFSACCGIVTMRLKSCNVRLVPIGEVLVLRIENKN